MLSNVSKKLACLMFAGMMLGVTVAEAGTIPTSSVPLYTYASKKIYCYNSPGGAQKGYIDPGDDITITKVQSNGWVYGNYPTARGRVSRWFKASDLLADRAANYTRYAPKATTTVYRDSSYRSSLGSVNNNETITVVGGSGNSRQIIYKLSNGKGYKLGWLPERNALTYEQAFGPKPNPAGYFHPLGNKNYKFRGSNSANSYKNHDYSISAGTPVYAICDGTAYFYQITGTYKGKNNTLVSYGNYIQLKSGGIEARYGHLDSFKGVQLKYGNAKNYGSTYKAVKNYNKRYITKRAVKKGDILGYVGTTGNSSGNHLHFELWVNGKRQEPNNYF
ncbi:MAG: M23 family metallopeptidase [Phascolarctobacterium sp.]|nr:M23 family metallopeptidase [Phascolarctobacterium sp.]